MVTLLPSFCRLLFPTAPFVTQFENVQRDERDLGKWTRLVRRITQTLRISDGENPYLGTLLRQSTRIIGLISRHLEELESVRPRSRARSVLIPAPPIMRIVDDPDGSVRKAERARLGFADDRFVIAFFGYVYPSKGIETLLAAIAEVSGDSNIHLLVIGGHADEGYVADLKQIANERDIVDRITWVGHCEPDSEIATKLLRASDCCVLPFDIGVRLNNS